MYAPPDPGSKIIIVGAGCFGISTAYALSQDKEKNYDIWVYDRDKVPVPDAASTDISKAVRMDYGNMKLYLNLTLEAIDRWNQWNIERAKESLPPVFHNSGLLVLTSKDEFSVVEKSSMQNIRDAGHPDYIEELDGNRIKGKFPFLSETVDNGYAKGYHNTVGGWCNSSESIKHLYNKCLQNGVNFVLGAEAGCFTSLISDKRTVAGIVTKGGKQHHADRVIMAAGPWTSSVIDMHNKTIATGQYVVHFKLSPEDQAKLSKLPVWTSDQYTEGFYGFPDNGKGILKVAKHSRGYLNPRSSDGVSVPRCQSVYADDTIPVSALSEMRNFLDKFFPFTKPMDIVYARTCWYSDSIDGHFIIAPHPDYDNFVVAAGDSGHAMKFFPIIGEKIRQVVEKQENEYTRAWAWRHEGAKKEFYERPLLVKEGDIHIRMATQDELKARS